ncbi:hypothetical protein LCGC14_2040480, partial [marine sediment metagenome]
MPFPPDFFELTSEELQALVAKEQERIIRRLNEELNAAVVTSADIDAEFARVSADPQFISDIRSLLNRGLSEDEQFKSNEDVLRGLQTEEGAARLHAAIEDKDERKRFNLPPLQTRAPVERFDADDVTDLVDQLRAPFAGLAGTPAGNLVTFTILFNLLDNETRTIGDLSGLQQDLAPDSDTPLAGRPALGTLLSDIESVELDIGAHPETAGLDGLKLSQAVDAMVAKGLWTQAEANMVRGLDPGETVTLRDNQDLAVKFGVLIDDLRNPELNQQVRDGSGTYEEAFTAILDSPEEAQRRELGLAPLITLPADVAAQRLDVAADEDLRELAAKANTDSLVDELLADAGVAKSGNFTGDEAKVRGNVIKDIKAQVQAGSAGLTPEQKIGLARNAVSGFNALEQTAAQQLTAEQRQEEIDKVSTASGAKTAKNDFLFRLGVDAEDITDVANDNLAREISFVGGVTPEVEQRFRTQFTGLRQEK